MNPTYLNLTNFKYIEEQYQKYLDGNGVEPSWKLFFEGFDFAKNFSSTPSTGPDHKLEVHHLIQAYRDFGYTSANLNPLEDQVFSESLKLEKFGLSESDLGTEFEVKEPFAQGKLKLKDILSHLKTSYLGTIGIQVAESHHKAKQWFSQQMEVSKKNFHLSKEKKLQIQDQLIGVESLEHFIHSRFVGAKRFSIEGADVLIPMLEAIVQTSSALGVQELVLGMAHRGRVNVLANFMGKGLENIFAEFDGQISEEVYDVGGDVKYHLGFSADRKLATGLFHLSLAFNPSHLEIVNPVVTGMARAKQTALGRDGDKRVVPVLVHGDAAFAGQGVVSETLQLSQLKGYRTGGTIHLIIDNQVGFTANPAETRSTAFASDLSRAILAPVIHVNGDDVEACIWAVDMAVRFRQEFAEDVVINLICYRRYGHNESDEPAFTQPLMYQKIAKHPSPRKVYLARLDAEKVLDVATEEGKYQSRLKDLQTILNKTKSQPPVLRSSSYQGAWKDLRASKPEDFDKSPKTAVRAEVISALGEKIFKFPSTFTVHPKLGKLFEKRLEMGRGKEPLDWGAAEILAFASLLAEGHPVRLSGQDCQRGTFSHRHCALRDYKTGESYNVLESLFDGNKKFHAINSLLSELAVLGFEYGHAITDPHTLTIWEAQFGDFVNGAQIVIDQFISAAEVKWYRASGLVMLLPHGYEGQGPEHSSARPERFLQLCAQENMQVCNLTTPAQIFHALRRQIKWPFRKPLVVMSPKSLLRNPLAASPLSDLTGGSFQEVLDDNKISDVGSIDRIIICSGKIYYDILQEREKRKENTTALIRLEQWYPFPAKKLVEVFSRYLQVKSFVYAQEEPQNMGAMSFVSPRLHDVLMRLPANKRELKFVSRGERASPATGSHHVHSDQQAKIIDECFKP